MFAHIVPQVYQKSWHNSIGSRNVYYFDKNNIEKTIDERGGNIARKFGAIDEYIITEEDRKNGLINDASAIEDFLSHGVENQWNKVVSSDLFEWLEKIKDSAGKVKGIRADDLRNTPFEKVLLDYIILQQLRIYENFIEIDNGTIDFILKLVYFYLRERNLAPTDAEFESVVKDETFRKTIWKSILIACKDNDDSFLSIVRRSLEEKCNLTFAYLNDDIKARFILSDNPVIWNCSPSRKYKELESGIYFPITPNCLAMFLNFDNQQIERGDAICVYPNDGFVKHINYCLLNQSREMIGFMCNTVNEHISEDFDKVLDWDLMFK